MKFKIIKIFLLLIGLGINAQSYKPFVPTKGEIVFREISKITDRKSFDESLKTSKQKFKESLIKSILKEPENKGREKEIEQLATYSSEMLGTTTFRQDSILTYHHQYNNSQIRSFISRDQNMNFIKNDEIIDDNYAYSANTILKMKVDKKSKKTINGYDCYKVVYEYKENNENSDEYYLNYAGNTIYQREMWVTEKIKSLYHPIIREKQILNKYYPLDIVETQNDIKGFEKKYTLEKITL